jgi:hypothetical protein
MIGHALEPFLPERLEVTVRLQAGHVAEAAKAQEHHLRVSLDRAVARIAAVTNSQFEPNPLPYLELLRLPGA